MEQFIIMTQVTIFIRIKKGEDQGKEKCHVKSMMSNEPHEKLEYTLSM